MFPYRDDKVMKHLGGSLIERRSTVDALFVFVCLVQDKRDDLDTTRKR